MEIREIQTECVYKQVLLYDVSLTSLDDLMVFINVYFRMTYVSALYKKIK